MGRKANTRAVLVHRLRNKTAHARRCEQGIPQQQPQVLGIAIQVAATIILVSWTFLRTLPLSAGMSDTALPNTVQHCQPAETSTSLATAPPCPARPGRRFREFAHTGVYSRKHSIRARRKAKGRTKEEIEKARQDLQEKTRRAVETVAQEFHARLTREDAKAIGAIYARYSTRFQDSIEDQIRTLYEKAVSEAVFVPVENVFYDLAAKGNKARRPGLTALQQASEHKRFTVLLVFATNRLYRKLYRSLKFVEEQVESGVRCIFVKSAIDTSHGDNWKLILSLLGALDEQGVSMYADHVRAGQEGLFLRDMICGTIPAGYTGEDIPGEFTKRKRPRRRVIIDPDTSRYVTQIFEWFAKHRLTLAEIARRLNDDQQAPAPAKSMTGEWTPCLVRAHLQNDRYRGYWVYGKYKSVWRSKLDYPTKEERSAPLQAKQVETLRIIADDQWYAAQRLLGDQKSRSGRRSKYGNQATRPALLRQLFVCPGHDNQPLTVGGANAERVFCKKCACQRPDQRHLFSQLNRQLSVELTCGTIADLLLEDAQLLADVVAACQHEVALCQQPDPEQLRRLKSKYDKLTRAIQFNTREPGETEADQAETARIVRAMREERNALQGEIKVLETKLNAPIEVPTESEVYHFLENTAQILQQAASSIDDEQIATAREIIELITGGQIELFQMGERRKHGGWLQGRFQLRLLSFAVDRLTGLPCGDEGRTVVIDYRRPSTKNEESEVAWRLYKQDQTNEEIGNTLSCKKSKVLRLLKLAAAKHGEELESPAQRSRRMARRSRRSAYFREIADLVQHDWEQGLSLRAIGRRHKCSDTTARKALAHWYAKNNLELPLEASRRDAMCQRVWQMVQVEQLQLQQIAKQLGCSRRTVAQLLREYCERQGIPPIDGRSCPAARRSKPNSNPSD